MARTGRIVLLGIAAGLVVFIWGTVSHLVLTPFAVGSDVFREPDLARVWWSFVMNVALGFFYVAAYGLTNGGHAPPLWRRLTTFFGLLFLLGVAPRALISYRYFGLGLKTLLGWTISWTAEAVLVTFLVVLLWPRRPAVAPSS